MIWWWVLKSKLEEAWTKSIIPYINCKCLKICNLSSYTILFLWSKRVTLLHQTSKYQEKPNSRNYRRSLQNCNNYWWTKAWKKANCSSGCLKNWQWSKYWRWMRKRRAFVRGKAIGKSDGPEECRGPLEQDRLVPRLVQSKFAREGSS